MFKSSFFSHHHHYYTITIIIISCRNSSESVTIMVSGQSPPGQNSPDKPPETFVSRGSGHFPLDILPDNFPSSFSTIRRSTIQTDRQLTCTKLVEVYRSGVWEGNVLAEYVQGKCPHSLPWLDLGLWLRFGGGFAAGAFLSEGLLPGGLSVIRRRCFVKLSQRSGRSSRFFSFYLWLKNARGPPLLCSAPRPHSGFIILLLHYHRQPLSTSSRFVLDIANSMRHCADIMHVACLAEEHYSVNPLIATLKPHSNRP